jgi:capsule synthesis protein PGA_cap
MQVPPEFGSLMSVRFLAMGDLCPGDHYFTLGHGTGSHLAAGANPLSEIASILGEADISLVNLEGPLSNTSCHGAGPEAEVFRGPTSVATLLKQAGIELVHVANNHVLQHGLEAFRSTISVLETQEISPVGLAECNFIRPVIRVVRGLTLGFLGCSFVSERYVPGQSVYAALPLPTVLRQIAELKTRVDLVVVSSHWGTEGAAVPDAETTQAADAMVDAGATLVLGHHPHRFQPIKRVGHALIAYSLGDFVFDLFWDRHLVESAILSVEMDRRGVVDYRLIPVRFDTDYKLRLQTVSKSRRFLKELSTDQSTPLKALRYLWLARQGEAWRKMAYFLSVFHHGKTSLKTQFVLGKITTALKRAARANETQSR